VTAGPPLLELRDVRKAFGGVRALDGVSLAVAPGEVRALIGPNGAGKTSLFDVVTGHLRPDAGSVRYAGRPIDGLPPHRICRRGLARTFQIPAVFPYLSVRENVQVALAAAARRTLSLRGLARSIEPGRAAELLGRVGLDGAARQPARTLAHGDQKKLELAIALAAGPSLLLLDEPTAGMAPADRQGLMALVGALTRERGLTLLFTEHDMDVVFQAADRITVLHQGRVIADGPPDAVRADAGVQRVYLGAGA
jgi:branched-chain amino acid transport system ATP-binding protein